MNAVPTSRSKQRLWAGRILSALPAALLIMSAVMKLRAQQEVIRPFVEKFGYQESVLSSIGILELACTVLYAIPQTAALGAVLLTGYLGGAVATHVRIGEPFLPPLLIGVLLWAGLYLRDGRVRALLPLRISDSSSG